MWEPVGVSVSSDGKHCVHVGHRRRQESDDPSRVTKPGLIGDLYAHDGVDDVSDVENPRLADELADREALGSGEPRNIGDGDRAPGLRYRGPGDRVRKRDRLVIDHVDQEHRFGIGDVSEFEKGALDLVVDGVGPDRLESGGKGNGEIVEPVTMLKLSFGPNSTGELTDECDGATNQLERGLVPVRSGRGDNLDTQSPR